MHKKIKARPNLTNNAVVTEMADKAKSLLELILESSTKALSHVNLFGFTYMHMAPAPTIQQMDVVLRLLKANIEFILKAEADEITLDEQTKKDLETSLEQINLMTMLADAIKEQDKYKFDEAVAKLEQTIPA